MAKIRGLKPELWTDEKFVELSPYARLLWMGLWNYACDNGHVQDKSKQLKMRVLPTDDVNCAELLREIEGQGLIDRADGWIDIPNLSHHQKPHKHWYVLCEKPGCIHPPGMTYGIGKSACEKPDCRHGSTVGQPLSNGGSPVEQPVVNGGSTADVDVEGDGEGDGDKKPSSDKSAGASRFQEFWDTYGKKNDRRVAERRYRIALKKRGVTEDLLISSAAAYVTALKSAGKFPQYAKDPSRWLNEESWDNPLPERQAHTPEKSNLERHLDLVRELSAAEGQSSIWQIGGAS